jgi:hypothetical protein
MDRFVHSIEKGYDVCVIIVYRSGRRQRIVEKRELLNIRERRLNQLFCEMLLQVRRGVVLQCASVIPPDIFQLFEQQPRVEVVT